MTFCIRQVVGLATVQDHGRIGFMHRGIPRGGALVRTLCDAANASVGNTLGSACVEVFGRLVIEAVRECEIGTDMGEVRSLRIGETFILATSDTHRVHYLAVAGGIDVPLRLGSRSTLLSARFGGHEGRALQRDDVLHALAGNAKSRRTVDTEILARAIRIVVGPDAHLFPATTFETFVRAEWILSPASNRTGTRLSGPALVSAEDHMRASMPMVMGAVEVPADGAPVVLGPEHPVTGGYPILAVVCADSLDAFFSRPISSVVRFTT